MVHPWRSHTIRSHHTGEIPVAAPGESSTTHYLLHRASYQEMKMPRILQNVVQQSSINERREAALLSCT